MAPEEIRWWGALNYAIDSSRMRPSARVGELVLVLPAVRAGEMRDWWAERAGILRARPHVRTVCFMVRGWASGLVWRGGRFEDGVEGGMTSIVFEEGDSRVAKALELARKYGQIDGEHHKAWTIDQMVRALLGDAYEAWVAEACDGEDGPETYDWDVGTPP